MVNPVEPCFPCHGSTPRGVFCSVRRAVYIYTLSERRNLTMKYEAPVAVVVDFENDYVVAAGPSHHVS